MTPERQHASGASAAADVEGEDRAPSLPPVIRLERQATMDPSAIDEKPTSAGSPAGVNTEQLSADMGRVSLRRGVSWRTVSHNSTASVDSNTTTPTKTPDSRRLSRRIIDSVQRLGPGRDRSRSNSSRASAYLPEFRPIDRSGDVESQYEERAVILARAGPPSPALPRSDSLFDMGAPRIPPIKFDTAQHASDGPGVGTLDSLNETQDQAVFPDTKIDAAAIVTPPRTVSSSAPPSRASRTASADSHPSSTPQIPTSALTEQMLEDMPKDDLLQRAIIEHESGNLVLATQLFRRSGQGEDALAIGQLMYGLSLRHGWGCGKDETKAIKWLRRAAESSADREAELLSSTVVNTDNSSTNGIADGNGRAVVRHELVLAIFELGNCFRYGWGCERDPDLARHYYETAANLGDADAMAETAWCYETGFGVRKDKFKTAYWYRSAERAGNRTVGMQWIWKPKYDHDPFVDEVNKDKAGGKKRGLNWLKKKAAA